MFLVTCLIGLVYLIGISTFVLASHRAPEGFQDEDGFHYGSEETSAGEEAAANSEQMHRSTPQSGGSHLMNGRIHAH